MRRISMTIVACIALTAQAMSQGQPAVQAPQIETKKVDGTEGVYTFRNQNSQAMFIVTSDGVIATDPVSYGRPTGRRTISRGDSQGHEPADPLRRLQPPPFRSHRRRPRIQGGGRPVRRA